MSKLFRLNLLLVGLLSSSASTNSALWAQATKKIVLAGDSTVTDDAGWGIGFRDALGDDVECLNLAKGGRSSRSYRDEGWWKKCLDAKPDYVLIQFGHNDQPGKGPERESAAASDFRIHLKMFVEDARAAGIQPVLVTSLERRRWNDRDLIIPSLSDYADATKAVARELSVPLIDLHALSIAIYNELGATAVRAFEPMSEQGADHTHLNAAGSQRIGQMVARELVRVVPETNSYLAADKLTLERPRAGPADASSELCLTETAATITVACGQRAILVYNKQSPPVPGGIDPVYQRSGFLHPVATPAGKVVTATFPVDHAHQHGIFSAWVKTTYDDRDIDFWNLAGRTGRVLHQRVVATFNSATGTGFEVDLIHQTVEPPVVDVLGERWKVVAYPTDGSFHCFDINSRQQALTDKPLIVRQYHYGGFALRGPIVWLKGENLVGTDGKLLAQEPNDFLNDRGSDGITGNHQHARWVSLYGLIDGRSACITVLSPADNFRAPQAARLHPSKPYFCFAPCVDGEFKIDKQHPLLARYRYLVTDAKPDVAWIEKQWHSFNSQSE